MNEYINGKYGMTRLMERLMNILMKRWMNILMERMELID